MLLLTNLKYVLWMVILIFFQVAIFNNINFYGYANPYIYVIFILLYPLDKNKYIFLIAAFILGLSIDFFEHTGGVNAFAAVFVAYFRYYIVQLIHFRKTYESEEIKLGNLSLIQWVIYMAIIIYIHHFLVYFMDSFIFDFIGSIAYKSLLGAGLTFILTSAFLLFFPIEEKSEY